MYCTNNDSLPPSCLNVNNATVQEILGSLVPNCKRGAWSDIGDLWLGTFYFHVVAFGLAFLLIGIACVVFLSKRHLAQRFKTKTFIAIDVSLCILGFSKFFFYVLDPYGIAGFCPPGLPCMITSRLFFSLGFPSLTAAYTLVFLTLWYSARMKLGRSCIQRWRVIIPLCFIHYVVAVVFEFVGAFGDAYYIIFLLLVCEAVFTIWGLVVCGTFLVGGLRLLHSVRKSANNSSIVSTDVVIQDSRERDGKRVYTRSQSTMRLKIKKTHQQALRKIAIVTYSAAILGALYSLFGIANLVMLCLQLFGDCVEEGLGQNSNLWLALKYLNGVIEVFLAILLLYSINDVRPVVHVIKNGFGLICHCGHVSDTEKQSSDNSKNDIFEYEGTVTTINSRGSSPVSGIPLKDAFSRFTLTRTLTNRNKNEETHLQSNGDAKDDKYRQRNYTLPSTRRELIPTKSDLTVNDTSRDSKSSSDSNGECGTPTIVSQGETNSKDASILKDSNKDTSSLNNTSQTLTEDTTLSQTVEEQQR